MEFLGNYWQFIVPVALCIAAGCVIAFTVRRDRLEYDDGSDPMEPYMEVREADERLARRPKPAE